MDKERLSRIQKESKEATERANQILQESRQIGDRFYQNLGFFSGATIVLSITFLGYLKSVPNFQIQWIPLLMVSWALLTISLVSSLYRGYFYSSYHHYRAMREFTAKWAETKKATKEYISKYPSQIANINTPEELTEFIGRMDKEAKVLSEGSKWHKLRENIFKVIWSKSEIIACLFFPIGLVCILVFAMRNLV
ncbi:MAG TPA: hypothetical protein EYP78_05605 [Candidatus Omnitrophica bacterium]|nr:hypothetical protein [Candidatus Omnitrophota bacterium]